MSPLVVMMVNNKSLKKIPRPLHKYPFVALLLITPQPCYARSCDARSYDFCTYDSCPYDMATPKGKNLLETNFKDTTPARP